MQYSYSQCTWIPQKTLYWYFKVANPPKAQNKGHSSTRVPTLVLNYRAAHVRESPRRRHASHYLVYGGKLACSPPSREYYWSARDSSAENQQCRRPPPLPRSLFSLSALSRPFSRGPWIPGDLARFNCVWRHKYSPRARDHLTIKGRRA